jgi:hypothetical protein
MDNLSDFIFRACRQLKKQVREVSRSTSAKLSLKKVRIKPLTVVIAVNHTAYAILFGKVLN